MISEAQHHRFVRCFHIVIIAPDRVHEKQCYTSPICLLLLRRRRGQTYLEAAIRETFEETGVKVEPDDLTSMGVVRADYTQGPYRSNAMRGLFSYKFEGNVSDLKVEDGDGAGFVSLPIDTLEH